jgi:fructokinase
MFGPLNVNKNSDDFGSVLNTPKPGWKYFNVVKAFSNGLNIDKSLIAIEIDVGCAAYLEHRHGNHKYISI